MSLADLNLQQNKSNPIQAKILSKWDSVLLLIIIFIAFLPVFWNGWPHTDDGTLHLYRLDLLSEAIREGAIYPRWMPKLVLGFGYPLFHFYAPATYYIGTFLNLIGLSTVQALVGTFFLLTMAAGFGMRLLARDLFIKQREPLRTWMALIAATAYIFAPYFLTNIYVRGAIAEVGAQALIPWIFWSFGRLVKHENPEKYFLWASLSLALLAITHNISLLFIPPALIVYLAILFKKGQWQQAKWVSAAGLLAMGLSAFFWLPLIIERSYLAETAYEQVKQFIIYRAWTFETILDPSLRFQYSSSPPFRIGIVQVTLALIGFVLARRFDREWIFWLLLALFSVLIASRLASPIWQASEILLIAQFPWRLLIIITPVLALFTAGIMMPLKNHNTILVGGTAVFLIIIIIFCNWPRYPWSLSSSLADIDIAPGNLPHFEKEIGALGTSSSREFMPRWVDELNLVDEHNTKSLKPTITLQEATSTEMAFTIDTEVAMPIQWTNFYFPGWQVTMNDQTELTPYPSTPAGLMTIDIPAGIHHISLHQTGTTWQHIATIISIISALIFLTFLGLKSTHIPWWSLPLLFIICCGLLMLRSQSTSQIISPTQVNNLAPIQLLGLQTKQTEDFLELTPYWFIQESISSFQPEWQLKDKNGTGVVSLLAPPYYAAIDHISFPSGTIFDDAYLLPLPTDLPADTYILELITSSNAPPIEVANVTLTETSAHEPSQDDNPQGVIFGEEIALQDFELEINGDRITGQDIPVVYPGDQIQYRQIWQAQQLPSANYRGTLHFTDQNWHSLMQSDHHLGKATNFSRLWHPGHRQNDIYRFEIPADKPSGLYWPRLSVYDIKNGEIIRLDASNIDGMEIGPTHTLSALKVVNNPKPKTNNATNLQLGDIGKLIGYELVLPPSLKPGDTISLTLSFLSSGTSQVDFSRFIHLSSPEHGLIAQADGTPQDGINPTSVWVDDEIINDQIIFSIPEGSLPGNYQLFVGIYNPLDGSRLPIQTEDGQYLENNQFLIAEVVIQ